MERVRKKERKRERKKKIERGRKKERKLSYLKSPVVIRSTFFK